MRRPIPAADWSDLLAIEIDRGAGATVFRQVFDQLTRLILTGTVAHGSRLPPTRVLAKRLHLARTVVVSVYDQLIAEGYAEGRPGAGTFVAARVAAPEGTRPGRPPEAGLPAPAARYARLRPDEAQFATAPFNTGRCTLDRRTMDIWRRLTAAQLRRPDPAWLGYTDPRGAETLREALAGYLRASRGVRCDPAQIMILSGTQQALDLLIKILIEPGDRVWMEDPGYPAMQLALQAGRAELVPVRVDEDGLVVAEGVRRAPDARLAYVTPSHQSPSGVVLSMERRLELLAWARERRAWVIEDDYDSEFRYAGRPLASLQGMDDAARVIYLGTFSKIVFPALRLGYAVLPYELLDAMVAARHLSDRHVPGLTESVVTAFVEGGHLGAHLRRMCAMYRESRDLLVYLLQERAGAFLSVTSPDSGMHLTAWLRDGLDDVAVARAGMAHGVVLRPMSRCAIEAPPASALMLGFTGYDAATLRGGVDRLVRTLESFY